MPSDLPRRLAHRFLYPALEELWGRAFALAGRAAHAEAGAPSWSAGQRAVIVAPHPDDETIGAGGVAALHLRAGDPVTAVVVTDGGASRAQGLDEPEMIRRRAAEVRAATEILGIRDLVCLGLPEGRWQDEELRERLLPVLAGAEVVYAPSCVDFHPEHLRVARVLAELLDPRQRVRVFELGVPLTPRLANRVARIHAVARLKARALAAYRTQARTLAALQRLARHQARYYGGTPVEVFWELTPAAYARVMAAGDWRRDGSPYRGIHLRPLADPRAVLSGLRARAALQRVAELPEPAPERPLAVGGRPG